MDSRKILIANLAKGQNRGASNLLGSLLVSHLEFVAMTPSELALEERVRSSSLSTSFRISRPTLLLRCFRRLANLQRTSRSLRNSLSKCWICSRGRAGQCRNPDRVSGEQMMRPYWLRNFIRCRRMSLPTRARSGHGSGEAMLAIGRYSLSHEFTKHATAKKKSLPKAAETSVAKCGLDRLI